MGFRSQRDCCSIPSAINCHKFVNCHYDSYVGPTQSPMQFYFTNLQSDSVRVHWVYSESPRTGMLIGFIVYTYEQDTRFPEREGGLVIREVFSLMSNQDSEAEEFSYQLMYLKPGFTYNVFVSAITTAGEGPRGRTSLTTLRTGALL